MSLSERRSPISDRIPRLWALWASSRPSQILLILLLYLLGVGVSTVGSPLIAGGETATALEEVVSLEFGLPVVVGALTLVPVAVTIHYANEYADVDTDALTDRTPFSGGSGAIVETGLPAAFLRTATTVSLLVSVIVIGVVAVTAALPPDAVGLLVTILLLGLAYSLPPTVLVRRGVGEVVNAILGGLLLPLYGVAVLSTPTPTAGLVFVPFTLVVGCNLLATHWPDREADATVGKRTVVVRWSPTTIRRVYAALAVGAGAVVGVLWWIGTVPTAVGLAHLAPLPFLLWGWAVLTRQESPLPSVLAMVVLAVTTTLAWWWAGVGG